jgi:hypothetical protein
MASAYSEVESRGARFITAMVEESDRSPATAATVESWTKKYRVPFDQVLDPTHAEVAAISVGLPYHVVIDPRTMRIVRIVEGEGAAIDSAVESLLKRNGG